ncbi:hypothetical protein O6H91_Y256200 [Diphasiastrum complanatum]|nr:hypothetical protein O6H91_Y256200 [Diphasiastrum complanatum]
MKKQIKGLLGVGCLFLPLYSRFSAMCYGGDSGKHDPKVQSDTKGGVSQKPLPKKPRHFEAWFQFLLVFVFHLQVGLKFPSVSKLYRTHLTFRSLINHQGFAAPVNEVQR